MANRAQMMAGFVARNRRRKPPRPYQALGKNPNKGQYFVPGIGQYGAEQNRRAFLKRHPEYAPHDDYPYPHGPFRPKRRGPTRPTPGSVYNRNKPQRN